MLEMFTQFSPGSPAVLEATHASVETAPVACGFGHRAVLFPPVRGPRQTPNLTERDASPVATIRVVTGTLVSVLEYSSVCFRLPGYTTDKGYDVHVQEPLQGRNGSCCLHYFGPCGLGCNCGSGAASAF